MPITTIDKLHKLPLNEVWHQHDFIPWLQNNLEVINEVIGLTLVNANSAQPRDTDRFMDTDQFITEDSSGQRVIVSGQLTLSEPKHLGTLMTALAVHEVQTAVWIVADIQPQHRQALIWLNQTTPINFYLLIIEAIQIGQSPVAALLTLLVTPQSQAAYLASEHQPTEKKWDELHFFTELSAHTEEGIVDIARHIFNWAQTNVSYVSWREQDKMGYFVPVFYYKGKKHQLFAVRMDGVIEIYFQWYQYMPPFNAVEKRIELCQRLNEIKGVSIADTALSARPTLPLSALYPQQALHHFLETYNWFIREV